MNTSNDSQSDSDTLIITEIEAGQRLDKILAQRFVELRSRTYFQTLIEDGNVLLNGQPVKKRALPAAGDEVQVHFVITPEMGLNPENIPLDIIYEDEHILAINKPPGMVVHPGTGNWTGTFVNALLYHCKHLYEESKLNAGDIRPGIVHRLDKDTSGILLAAKTTLAQQRLIALFTSRKVYKEYITVCLGNPGNAVIDAPIGRHPVHRQQMAIVDTGRPSVSRCKTLLSDGKVSLVEVVLETGRTHQIRVHMKHRCAPVLGDAVYGNEQANEKHGATRQLLHAQRLRFVHPMTGKELEIVAELPEDIKIWKEKLQIRAV